MLKSVRVPAQFEPPFMHAEGLIEKLFSSLKRNPTQGTIHIEGERYVLVRAESLYLHWFESLSAAFGEDTAQEFIYNTAREIGRGDSRAIAHQLKLTDITEKLAAGPVHFAHSGWALVEILDDSAPAPDESYYIHYNHPNTFESEVINKRGMRMERCVCLFSAGYSAGWCSEAFGVNLHGREIRCTAKGDSACEFIMAPMDRLDEYEQRLRLSWK